MSVTLPRETIEFMKKVKEEIGLSVSDQIELKLKDLNLCEKHDVSLYSTKPKGGKVNGLE